MNSRTLIIFDFDRTLFDLTSFLRDIQTHVWQLPALTDSELAVRNPTLEVFLDIDSMTNDHVSKLWLAPKLMPKQNYLYDDAIQLLKEMPSDYEPVIVTHGVSEHKQYFKRGFAGEIHDIPFYVTDDNKGYILRDSIKAQSSGIHVELPHVQGNYARVILIDDNPVSFEPLIDSPIDQYHVARPNEPHANKAIPAGVHQVDGLTAKMLHLST